MTCDPGPVNNVHVDVFLQGFDLSKLMVPGQKIYSLPFDVVLNNNVALTYFIGSFTGVFLVD